MFADDDHLDDELEYEPFEDMEWTDPDDLDAIDLETLDDEITDEITTDDHTGNDTAVDAAPTSPIEPAIRRPPPASKPRPEPPSAPQAESEPEIEAAPEPEQKPPAITPVESAPEEPVAEKESAPPAEIPVAATPAPAASAAPESAPADSQAETLEETADDTPEEPPQPVIPPEVYCAILALPPEVGAGVLELRAAGHIDTMPPPGVILTPHFRTQDIDAVKTALADWTRIHLPVQLEITGIKAEVIGAQQYVAAWTLEPQEELQEAIYALRRALAALTLPLTGTMNTIGTHIMIGDHVPAEHYMAVIGQMQRDFESHVWQSTDLHLVRYIPDTAPEDSSITWELDQRFD